MLAGRVQYPCVRCELWACQRNDADTRKRGVEMWVCDVHLVHARYCLLVQALPSVHVYVALPHIKLHVVRGKVYPIAAFASVQRVLPANLEHLSEGIETQLHHANVTFIILKLYLSFKYAWGMAAHFGFENELEIQKSEEIDRQFYHNSSKSA
eukprot:3925116-Pleurochrysis_carterae.AAC.3